MIWSPSLRSRNPLAALRSHEYFHSYHFIRLTSHISRLTFFAWPQRGLRSRNSSRTAAGAESRYCYESASRRRPLLTARSTLRIRGSLDYQGPSAALTDTEVRSEKDWLSPKFEFLIDPSLRWRQQPLLHSSLLTPHFSLLTSHAFPVPAFLTSPPCTPDTSSP